MTGRDTSVPDPRWSAARPLAQGGLTVLLLIGGFGSWSVLTTLSGAIIAAGQVEVSESRQVVQHPDGGVIEDILVAEGDRVAAGDVLLRLDGSVLRSERAIVEAQLYELAARRARLEAQRDGARDLVFPPDLRAAGAVRADVAEMIAGETGLFTRQAEAMAQAVGQRLQQVVQIRSQIAGIAAQEAAAMAELGLLEADLSTQTDLRAEGLTPAVRVLAVERELAGLRGRMGELVAARAQSLGRIAEIEIEISALATQSREAAAADLRELVSRQLELAERALAIDLRIARLEVRAPAAGLVFGLQVTTAGSVVRAADRLMFIVPQDRPLIVAARVPASQVDEVSPGQAVRLVFSSLPTRTTPDLIGRVTVISADALTDERTGAGYYRAEIILEAAGWQMPDAARIRPGMPVQAFIRTKERSPLSYLTKPFTDYFRNAFRET